MKENKFEQEIEWKFSSQPVPYLEALEFMEERVEAIISGKQSQLIWILEHPPVYTAGISAKDCDLLNKSLIKNNSLQRLDNLGIKTSEKPGFFKEFSGKTNCEKASEAQSSCSQIICSDKKINEKGGFLEAPIIKVNRGGKYTYHCLGMKIIYVLLDLKRFFAPQSPDISAFVNFLENWIIAVLGVYGIKGEIHKGRVGIWVNNISKNQAAEASSEKETQEKIAAIGIKLKKWVSYHGIAVNLNCDLSGFSAIVPCGLSGYGITTIAKLGGNLKLNFEKIAKQKFSQEFQKKS